MYNCSVPYGVYFVDVVESGLGVDGLDESLCNGRYFVFVASGSECGEVDVHVLALDFALMFDLAFAVGVRYFRLNAIRLSGLVIVAGQHYKTVCFFWDSFAVEFGHVVFFIEYLTSFFSCWIFVEDAIHEDVVDIESAAVVACGEDGDLL